MSDDHLDKEISISAGITDSRIEAKAKSRTISALDRWFGGIFDRKLVKRETETAEIRAASDIRIDLMKAAAKSLAASIESDPARAEEILGTTLQQSVRRIENKRAVIEAAILDLRNEPPTAEQAASGPAGIDEDVLDRCGRFAEDANSQAAREKWGKVLAAEIRRPGSLGLKVLRLIDEIDPIAAQLFQKLCETRRVKMGALRFPGSELSFAEIRILTEADLIRDPGPGTDFLEFDVQEFDGGAQVHSLTSGSHGVAITVNAATPPTGIIRYIRGKFSCPIYTLTSAGNSIAEIIAPPSDGPVREIARRLAAQAPGFDVIFVRIDEFGKILNAEPVTAGEASS